MIASDATVIRTLRIKTAASDRLAARQHTARALQAASLRPIGLPRDAILIVRHVTARRTGTAGWEQAVNAELDQLARQAARPIEGAVPANAAAVIFADRSELLACLAADWCAGVVRAQWWWHSWLHDDDLRRAVSDAWLAAPEYIPLALHRLSARQQAIAFMQRLSADHTRSILHAVVQTFGLYELSAQLAEVLDHQAAGREVIAQRSSQTTSTVPVQAMPVAPWQLWVRTRVEHLPPDRQVLLGVGLMLHAAPSIVRSVSFASEVTAWYTAIRMVQRRQTMLEDSAEATTQAISLAGTTESATPRQAEVLDLYPAPPGEPMAAIDQPSLREGRELTQQSPVLQRTAPLSEEIAAPEAPHLTKLESFQADIETAFGGVCYFINLGLFLNLYGDFTTPLQPGLDLPIWDFVALVAQEVIGEEVLRDPIWLLLAQLADRAEDEPPGANFDPTSYDLHPSTASLRDSAQDAAHTMPTLQSWLADLMSIIRPRLQLALGASAEELPRYFKQRARLVVSAVNFDAYFALDDVPIEIRLAGLDRDPGWVPDAGRTVRFHYD